jgi:hypothetical protein
VPACMPLHQHNNVPFIHDYHASSSMIIMHISCIYHAFCIIKCCRMIYSLREHNNHIAWIYKVERECLSTDTRDRDPGLHDTPRLVVDRTCRHHAFTAFVTHAYDNET